LGLIGSQRQVHHHQDTKGTKFHQEKHDVNFVFLGDLGVLVVMFFRFFFNVTDY
jgi:hypothetical protein